MPKPTNFCAVRPLVAFGSTARRLPGWRTDCRRAGGLDSADYFRLKAKADLEAALLEARVTHTGSRAPLGWEHLVISNSRRPVGAGLDNCPAPDTSRVDTSVRGDIIDLTARDADVLELPVTQVEKASLYTVAMTSLLVCIPAYPEEARDVSRRSKCSLQPNYVVDRAHSGLPRVLHHSRWQEIGRRA